MDQHRHNVAIHGFTRLSRFICHSNRSGELNDAVSRLAHNPANAEPIPPESQKTFLVQSST